MFGVPRATLHDRITGRVQYGARSGPNACLTVKEEVELVTFLLGCAGIGYAHTRKELFGLVQQIVDSKGINTIITNGWWERFCKRNPPSLPSKCSPSQHVSGPFAPPNHKLPELPLEYRCESA